MDVKIYGVFALVNRFCLKSFHSDFRKELLEIPVPYAADDIIQP